MIKRKRCKPEERNNSEILSAAKCFLQAICYTHAFSNPGHTNGILPSTRQMKHADQALKAILVWIRVRVVQVEVAGFTLLLPQCNVVK